MADTGVGLIGFGLAGRAFHGPFVQATPGLALRAVVSRDSGKVQDAGLDVAVVPTVEALLALPEIDLVIIASPDHLHARHAIQALESGRHVLVDKPFAVTMTEARAVADAASRAGRMLTVFHNRRWDADFLTLRRLIADGTLGEIVELESRFDRWRPLSAGSWKEARDGGVWQDLGPHLVDQALCLFGMPDSVQADMARLRPGSPAPDWIHAVLRYPQRRVILRASKLAADHRLRFAVHGTHGSWLKHGTDPQEADALAGLSPTDPAWGRDPQPGRLVHAGAPENPTHPACERGRYPAFWAALRAALAGEGANPVPPAEALAVMAVLEACAASAKSGTAVAPVGA